MGGQYLQEGVPPGNMSQFCQTKICSNIEQHNPTDHNSNTNGYPTVASIELTSCQVGMANRICWTADTLRKICDHVWHLTTWKAICFGIEFIKHECSYSPLQRVYIVGPNPIMAYYETWHQKPRKYNKNCNKNSCTTIYVQLQKCHNCLVICKIYVENLRH